MSNLTRIKNNQITDSTILANVKIVPGSIVGSLFNANLTMTSDVTITGNLTVQGSSTYLTVASTNTYVNDPLIVMNNAYAGTNLYDIGLLFNRGSDTNQAFIWDETEDEFRLIATSETGTTYGNVTASSFANLHVGNITVDYIASVGTLNLASATLTGDLAVNGGDITTTASTFNLITANATTVHFANAATTLNIGATSGTTTVNNNLTIGNGGELLTVNGSMIVEGGVYGNVTTTQYGSVFARAYNSNAYSIVQVKSNDDTTGMGMQSFSGANGLIYSNSGISFAVGATVRDLDTPTGGTIYVTISNTGIVTLGNDIVSSTTTQNVFNTVATTVNAFGAATALNFGANTGTATLRNPTLVGTETTQNLYNTTATTMNFAGAATAINIGAASGTTNIKNNVDVDLTLNARDINSTVIGNVTPATGKFTNIYDTALTETRIPFVGTANVLTDSANLTFATDTLTIKDLTIDGDTTTIATSAGNINLLPTSGIVDVGSATLANVADPTELQDAVTLNYLNTQISSAVTNIQNDDSDITITDTGSAAGQITGNVDAVRFITVNANNTSFYGDSGAAIVYIDELNSNVGINGTAHIGDDLTVAAGGVVYVKDSTDATAVNSGALQVTGGASVAGNLYVGGRWLDTDETTFNLLTTATTLTVGATSGTLSLQNANIYLPNASTVFTGQATVAFANTATTTLNIGGDTTAITLGGTSGVTNLLGQANVKATTDSISTTTGAMVVMGGVGVYQDLNVGGRANINATDNSVSISTGALVVDGGAGFAKDVYIGGNLYVANIASINYSVLSVQDPLLYLTAANTYPYNYDIGIYSQFTGGPGNIYQHTGVIRNESDSKWYFFSNVAEEPDGGVDLTNAIYDTVVVGNLEVKTTAGIVTQLSSADVFNTSATTVNAFGAATTLTVGATTGTVNLRNANVYLPNATTLFSGQSTVSLLNENVTTLSVGGAATTLTIGSTSGTASLRNANVWLPNATSIDGAQTTVSLLSQNATTVDAFKAATDLEFGATTGTLTINNPTVVGTQTSQDLYNTTATTLNFAGAATSVVAGATTGTFNIRNANVYLPNATTLYSGQSTLDIANVNVTTLSIGGAATAFVLGATTGTLTLRNATVTTPGQIISTRAGSATTGDGQIFLNGSTSNRIDWNANGFGPPVFTTRSDGTKVVLYPALSGSSVDYAIGIDAATMWSSVPENGNSFNFKWYGAETLVANLSGTGNFTAVGDVAVNGGDLTTTATTFNLVDTDATTLNVGGAATSVVAGSTSGTFNIRNANLYLPNASTVFSGQSTVAFMNTVPTTVTAFTGATSLTVGATTGVTNIQSGNIYLPNAANIASTQATVAVFNTDTTTVNAFGAATSVVAGATTGTFNIRNANLYLPNASTIFSGQSTLSFANSVVTTADLLGDATSIRIGSSTSELIARSNVTVGSHLHVISDLNADNAGNGALKVEGGAYISANIVTPNIVVAAATLITGGFPSTTVVNGALVIESGGAGIDGNINVGDGAQFNLNQSLHPFRVYGKFANTLIYADSVTDTVTIGGSNVASVAGTTLRVNGNGAMIIPIGASSDRPGSSGNVDVDGMIRLNSTTNVFEYYIDGGWQTSQGAFTVISSDSFNGNGVANAFVLSSDTTTTATMVMINGVVQIPATSYSISGNVLTFTESPETGDVIDVRSLTTTVTVAEVGTGFNNFKANVDYLYLTTGSTSTEIRQLIDSSGLTTFTGDVEIYGNLTVKGNSDGQITIGDTAGDNVAFNADVNSSVTPNADDTYNLGSATKRWKNLFAGNIVHDQTAVNTSSTTTIIDSFATSDYSSAKYIVQVKNGANIEAMEALVVSTSADAYITTYGIINAGYAMGSLTANVVSGNVRLYYTTALTNSNVKVQTTYIV